MSIRDLHRRIGDRLQHQAMRLSWNHRVRHATVDQAGTVTRIGHGGYTVWTVGRAHRSGPTLWIGGEPLEPRSRRTWPTIGALLYTPHIDMTPSRAYPAVDPRTLLDLEPGTEVTVWTVRGDGTRWTIRGWIINGPAEDLLIGCGHVGERVDLATVRHAHIHNDGRVTPTIAWTTFA